MTIPHNIEAEQQLLGAILLDNSTYHQVADMLTPAHFYEPVHAEIYRLCGQRIAKDHLASPVTMASVMEGVAGLQDLGGKSYLVRLAGASIQRSEARHYAILIIEEAARRALAEGAQEALEGIGQGVGSEEAKLRLLTRMESLPEASGQESTVSATAALAKALQTAADALDGRTTFITTGIDALDRILRGLGPGDLMILGGMPSMGKTAAAAEIAKNIARGGRGVAVWSLEMEDDQVMGRIAASEARVPYAEFRSPSSQDVLRKLAAAASDLRALPLRIIPKYIRDIHAGMAAARRARRELGDNLGAIVVDYAQLVRAPGKSRYEQMTEVSIGLKTMGGLLGCPVIALCQLSREIARRDDKRPQMQDLKESGQFEQDADQIAFCHRPEYWLEREGPAPNAKGEVTMDARADWEAEMARWRNKMEFIVRKNRHGALGIVETGFHAPTNRFWSLDQTTMALEGEVA